MLIWKTFHSGGTCDIYCGQDVVIEAVPEVEEETGGVRAQVSGLEPTTTYSATIEARTDHGTYGPSLVTAGLMKTVASAPDKPSVTKTTVTTTGNILVRQMYPKT